MNGSRSAPRGAGRRLAWAALAAAALLPGRPIGAQESAFLDPAAATLFRTARDRWRVVDRSLVRYRALMTQRVAASLRLPLRDRTLYRSESASRVVWERDGGLAVQLLAAREQHPGGVHVPSSLAGVFDSAFDPARDPLLLGMGDWDDPDVAFVHPFASDSEAHYRYGSGDTLTLSLPGGRDLRIAALELVPRRDDPRLLSGVLWIEPERGDLVRAVYRLARAMDLEADGEVLDEDEGEHEDDLEDVPGLLKPLTFELSLVAVDYSLWDPGLWLPRSIHAEGTLRAGILSASGVMDVAYAMEEVVAGGEDAVPLGLAATTDLLAELAAAEGETSWRVLPRQTRRRGRAVRTLVPEDTGWLLGSPHLPPPVWDDAAGFVTGDDLSGMTDLLDALPGPERVTPAATFMWGADRPDLVRYNRIEGLSVGARGALRFGLLGEPVSAELTGRLGTADLEPRAELRIAHESLARRTELAAYRELRVVQPGSRALELGNSLTAAVFGRDDGDYWQATGGALQWTPPTARRATWRLRVYAERQEPVVPETGWALAEWIGGDDGFRANARADRADQAGVQLGLAPWWGADPARPGAGGELLVQAERGDFDFERARLVLRTTLPLPGRIRLAAEAGAGTAWGELPGQRHWILGGPASLRGFAPGALAGPSFARGRVELRRRLGEAPGAGALGLVLFADAAWAGARDALRWDDALSSAGVGVSVLDGVLRLDAAWGIRSGGHGRAARRLDLYLDGIL